MCAFPRMLGPLPTRSLLPSPLLLPRKPGEVWNKHGEARRSGGGTFGHARHPGQVRAAADAASRAGRLSRPPRHRWRLRLPRRGCSRLGGGGGGGGAGGAGRSTERSAPGAAAALRSRPRRQPAERSGGARRRLRLSRPGRRARSPQQPAAARGEPAGAPSPRSPRSAGRCARAALGGAAGPGAAHCVGEPLSPRRSPLLPAGITCPAAALRQQKRKMLQLGKVRTLPEAGAAARTPLPGLRSCRWRRVHVREEAIRRRAVR